MATFTAPNGATRTSKVAYTHAVLLTGEDAGPASDGKFYAYSWHQSFEAATKGLATAQRRGFTAKVVAVTSDETPAPAVEEASEAPAAKELQVKVLWRTEDGRTGERTVTSEEEAKSLIHMYRRSGLRAIRSLV